MVTANKSYSLPLCWIQTQHSVPFFVSETELRAHYHLSDDISVEVKNITTDSRRELEKIIGKFTPATRWVICGEDALLSIVLTRIMFLEKLELHEIAFLPTKSSSVMAYYHAQNPLSPKVSRPVMRDEKGKILLSRATILPAGREEKIFTGESYVDEYKIVGDTIRKIQIEPMETAPGLRARSKKKIGWTHWHSGRAVQTGGLGFITEICLQGKPDILTSRPRVTFYRHHIDMSIAR